MREKLADIFGRPERAVEWRAWADAERQRILTRAYNEGLGYFTQAFEGTFPDASNLLLPTLGIIEPTDPRFVSTVRAYERILVENGLMLRYRHADDFGVVVLQGDGQEGLRVIACPRIESARAAEVETGRVIRIGQVDRLPG